MHVHDCLLMPAPDLDAGHGGPGRKRGRRSALRIAPRADRLERSGAQAVAEAAPPHGAQRPQPRAEHAAAGAQREHEQQELPADAVLDARRERRRRRARRLLQPPLDAVHPVRARCTRAAGRRARCPGRPTAAAETRSPVRDRLTASGPCPSGPSSRDHLPGRLLDRRGRSRPTTASATSRSDRLALLGRVERGRPRPRPPRSPARRAGCLLGSCSAGVLLQLGDGARGRVLADAFRAGRAAIRRPGHDRQQSNPRGRDRRGTRAVRRCFNPASPPASANGPLPLER